VPQRGDRSLPAKVAKGWECATMFPEKTTGLSTYMNSQKKVCLKKISDLFKAPLNEKLNRELSTESLAIFDKIAGKRNNTYGYR